MKYLILKGGLGNQLFQLAKFFDLKEKVFLNNIQIDCRTGFFLDFKYKRSLEINTLLKSEYCCPFYISLFNSFILIFSKLIPFFIKRFPLKIIDDSNINLNLENNSDLKNKYILFNGYFQNSKLTARYLQYIKKFIKNDLKANDNILFESLYKDIKTKDNSVALCIRFYEESIDPRKHSNEIFGLKTVDEFNNVINAIEEKLISPFFYIFVQNENDFTGKLKFDSPFKFITHEKGYKGSWSRLKAQKYCKHHIFNNSTFYYWGSEFSSDYYREINSKQIIYASNNFIFKEIYKKNWTLF
jgi:hypothetical protein